MFDSIDPREESVNTFSKPAMEIINHENIFGLNDHKPIFGFHDPSRLLLRQNHKLYNDNIANNFSKILEQGFRANGDQQRLQVRS